MDSGFVNLFGLCLHSLGKDYKKAAFRNQKIDKSSVVTHYLWCPNSCKPHFENTHIVRKIQMPITENIHSLVIQRFGQLNVGFKGWRDRHWGTLYFLTESRIESRCTPCQKHKGYAVMEKYYHWHHDMAIFTWQTWHVRHDIFIIKKKYFMGYIIQPNKQLFLILSNILNHLHIIC